MRFALLTLDLLCCRRFEVHQILRRRLRMTIHLPRQVVYLVGLLAIIVVISFAIAEWRIAAQADGNEYVECFRKAADDSVGRFAEHRKSLPQPPTSPGSGASTEQRAAYDLAFREYQRATDAYRAESDELSGKYDAAILVCGRILDD